MTHQPGVNNSSNTNNNRHSETLTTLSPSPNIVLTNNFVENSSDEKFGALLKMISKQLFSLKDLLLNVQYCTLQFGTIGLMSTQAALGLQTSLDDFLDDLIVITPNNMISYTVLFTQFNKTYKLAVLSIFSP